MRGPKQTDLGGLERFALGQGGYFNRRDAQDYGIDDELLRYHKRAGRFELPLPGVYRLSAVPISSYDEYILAWVWTNYRGAISHESALSLYGLSDLIPVRIHVTVPRPFHRTSAPFQVHLSPLPEAEVQMYNDVRVTTPARSIIDSASAGTDPNQIYKAVQDALARGLVTPNSLLAVAKRRPNQHASNTRELITEALSGATQRAR